MRVAIVHDWLVGGGAELVVEQLHELYPEAPIYTSYATKEWQDRLDGRVITGYLQHWPFSRLRKFLPVLRQRWFRQLDLSGYDLVISSSGNGEAKFVRVEKPAVHICYCHSPTHFYWRHYEYYRQMPGFGSKALVGIALGLLVGPLRKRDYKAAQAVDYFIANSSHIQSDIKTFYHRDSVVIFPPVNTKAFKRAKSTARQGFITVGRQVPYKRVDLIVDACTKLSLPLKVLGVGPEHDDLVRRAGPTVEFISPASFSDLQANMPSAQAFILASFEDFGITPVEAMAAGTPVIAYKAGGALDYVVEGKTGLFFDEQSVDSLAAVLKNFGKSSFDSTKIASFAEKFSNENFRKQFLAYVSKCKIGSSK